ncbi:DUF1569 domain-containing protein [Paenibacillus filicis]|jgi:hypothetical protein|uniref:DUF1569 domain-containing protein n=1 Tax=Paenibacillus gyeongsangnamensis TaxID=3388067 RepID=A0ABT4QLQ7_9BACL|nr:DUF1569 domain-containing protein [Paenibacillus filicis]MCZ8517796.1 DUF1569 domain-containing protein [Paenibacillus filicis]
MNNIFIDSHMEEIIGRIDNLTPNSEPRWGIMNVAQMLAHCSSFQDIAMGIYVPQRHWLGKLIGPLVKSIIYNDKPLKPNTPTVPEARITDEKEFEFERGELKRKLRAFQANGPQKCANHLHPFFGKLTPEQWGKGTYKHLDHHLKQFGV